MMKTYKEMYFRLFGATAAALEELERGNSILAVLLLKEAQQQTEEWYMEADILPEGPPRPPLDFPTGE